MSSYFFDTNALIDLVIPDRPQHVACRGLVDLIDVTDSDILALTSNLKDVYYIFNRHYGDEAAARKVITFLCKMCVLVSLDDSLVELALACDEPDFEDGLVRCAAEQCGCEFIISRDEKAFAHSSCRRLSPAEALEALKHGEIE